MSVSSSFNSIGFLVKARTENGYSEKNYQKYESYVSQQIKSFRKILFESKKGSKNTKYKKKSIDSVSLESPDQNLKVSAIKYQLFLFEKAVVTARSLEEQYSRTEEPRNRYHMIRRMKKAIKEATFLFEFLQNLVEPVESLHIVSLVTELEAELCFKQEAFDKALYFFAMVRELQSQIPVPQKLESSTTKAYNSLLNENTQLIRFAAYRLDIDGARSNPIPNICSLYLSSSPKFDAAVGDLSLHLANSKKLKGYSFESKDSASASSLPYCPFGISVHSDMLITADSVPEIYTALDLQQKNCTALFDRFDSLENNPSLTPKDIYNILLPSLDLWTTAILKIQSSFKSGIKALKFCKFNYNAIMALYSLLSASLACSKYPNFYPSSSDPDTCKTEWFNLVCPDKATLVNNLASDSKISKLKKKPKTKNSSKSKRSHSSKSANTDTQKLSPIAQMALFLDNLAFHLAICQQISVEFSVKLESNIVSQTSKFARATHNLVSALSLVRPEKASSNEAKLLISNAKSSLATLSNFSLDLKPNMEKSNVFVVLSQMMLASSSYSFPSISSFNQLADAIEMYIALLESFKSNSKPLFNQSAESSAQFTPTVLFSKPTFYDLAGELVSMDIEKIAEKAGVSHAPQPQSSFTLSSIFNSFLKK
ncbi:hypothetical protein BB560_002324 [Smittium megazygosporum]|uniref:Signal recognition particle subunit SRP68 n=1 Tax=Smittium megazygosporum TaxID=133381 RepID=A0A2T9Z4D7_9FUNG|nr:hypothetical protein BB560_005503 [Smittium megazygosporum]PVV03212.1 hypothetical protein BB560_002324 [Smittium megazygosporum]